MLFTVQPADYYLAVPCPFRPVYALGCYCDEFKREFWFSEARELYKTYEQNPDAFVRDACGDGRPVDLPCLAVLTTLVVEIPANRTVDLLKKFVKMIREDYLSDLEVLDNMLGFAEKAWVL